MDASFFKKSRQPPLIEPWDVGSENNKVDRFRRIYNEFIAKEDYYDEGRLENMVKKVGKGVVRDGGDDEDDDESYGGAGDMKVGGEVGWTGEEKGEEDGKYLKAVEDPSVKSYQDVERLMKKFKSSNNLNKNVEDTNNLQQLYNNNDYSYGNSENSIYGNSYGNSRNGITSSSKSYGKLGTSSNSYDKLGDSNGGNSYDKLGSNGSSYGKLKKRDRWQGFCFKRTRSGRRLPYICWRESKKSLKEV